MRATTIKQQNCQPKQQHIQKPIRHYGDTAYNIQDSHKSQVPIILQRKTANKHPERAPSHDTSALQPKKKLTTSQKPNNAQNPMHYNGVTAYNRKDIMEVKFQALYVAKTANQ